jgi:hypothetical protein
MGYFFRGSGTVVRNGSRIRLWQMFDNESYISMVSCHPNPVMRRVRTNS